MRITVPARFVTAALALLGCGEGGGSDSVVGLSQFPEKYAQALCAQNFRCCSATDIGSHTIAECLDSNTSSLEFFAAQISDSQTRRRVAYDADKMQMCIDAIAALSCEQWSVGFSISNQPMVCTDAIAPKVQPGGACLGDIDCTTHTCEGADLPAGIQGTCSATTSLGKPCTNSADCSTGFYCELSTNTCAAKKAAGEACDTHLECATSCNLTTGVCSCYAGCAVGGETPEIGISWLLAGAALLLIARRARRSRPRPTS
jgi:hypothetical protein